MKNDEYFKLCTALVQEQVYTWVIASSFVKMLLEALLIWLTMQYTGMRQEIFETRAPGGLTLT